MAAARTAHQAAREFGDTLQRAVACITTGVIQFGGHSRPDQPQVATLNRGLSVLLKTALDFDLGLKVSISFRVEQPPVGMGWVVSPTRYLYGLTTREGRDMMAWHRHPELPQANRSPHMHIYSAALNDAFMALEGRHLPTGMVAVEDVIRSCIEEFGVEPRQAGWRDTLRRTREVFQRNAT